MKYLEQRRAGKLKERAEKKKGIRPRSTNMIKELKIYSKQRISYLKTFPICGVITCDNWATDVHHKQGRGLMYLLDESTWMPVCRSCHKEIEENPKWAKEKGYSLIRLT